MQDGLGSSVKGLPTGLSEVESYGLLLSVVAQAKMLVDIDS